MRLRSFAYSLVTFIFFTLTFFNAAAFGQGTYYFGNYNPTTNESVVYRGDSYGGSTAIFSIPGLHQILDIESDGQDIYYIVENNASDRLIYKNSSPFVSLGQSVAQPHLAVDDTFLYTVRNGVAEEEIIRIDKTTGVETVLYVTSDWAPTETWTEQWTITDIEVHDGSVYWSTTGIATWWAGWWYVSEILRDGVSISGEFRSGYLSSLAVSESGRVFAAGTPGSFCGPDLYAEFPDYTICELIDQGFSEQLDIYSARLCGSDPTPGDIEATETPGGIGIYSYANIQGSGAVLKGDQLLHCGVQFPALGVSPTPLGTCSAKLTLPFGGAFHRADIHGIPMPERNPTDSSESDREESALYVDTYSLQPHMSTSDVRIPLEGGELELEFRRTFAVTAKRSSALPQYQVITYPSDLILGPGWSSNLSSHITIAPESCFGTEIATATDEVGTSYRYWDNGLSGEQNAFPPDTYFSLNNQAERATLYRVDADTLVLKKIFGTRLTYHRISRFFPPSGNVDYYEDYYRLESIEDRNNNRIVFHYISDDPLMRESFHVSEMFEAAHPERRITFAYTLGTGSNGMDWGDRLSSATDPLGRQTVYQYGDSGGLSWSFLNAVVREQILDGESGTVAVPITNFTYYGAELAVEETTDPTVIPAENPLVRNRYVALASVSDPRGSVTSLSYASGYVPSAIGMMAADKTFGKSVYLNSLTTTDGTVLFARTLNTHEALSTQVADTRGNISSYDFVGYLAPAANLILTKLSISYLTRTTPIGSVQYYWSDDSFANLYWAQDISGNWTSFDYYSSSGDPVETLAAKRSNQPVSQFRLDIGTWESITTGYQYGILSKLTSTTDAEGKVVSYILDSNGNRTAINEELGKTTIQTFATDGFLSSVTDGDGRLTTFTRSFNPGNLNYYYTVTETVKGYSNELSLSTERTFDVMGNLTRTIDPNGHTYEYDYDKLYRLKEKREPLSGSVTTTYTLNGDPVTETDFLGNKTIKQYDSMNRLTEERRDMGATGDIVVTYTYDAAGQKRTKVDGENHTTRYTYDEALRLTDVTFDEGGLNFTEHYDYGVNSGSGAFTYTDGWQPTRVTNRRGFFTDTIYDGFYRPIEVRRRGSAGVAEPTTLFSYNKVHKETEKTILSEVEGGGDRVLRTIYDDLHRPAQSILNVNGTDFITEYSFDLNGNKTSVRDPEGRLTETVFDGANRPTIVRQPPVASGTPETVTEYDDNGNVTKITDPKGNVTKITYDERNRETVRVLDLNGDGVFSEVTPGEDIVALKSYDEMDNVLSKTDSNGKVYTFTHDAAYREIERHEPSVPGGIPIWKTEYDRNSNPTRREDPQHVVRVTTYDGLDRVLTDTLASGTSSAQTTSYEYDENDNVTAKILDNGAFGVQRTEFAFDPFDRLIRETWPVGGASSGISTSSYYQNGLLKEKTEANGQRSTYSYDTAGRAKIISLYNSSGSIDETRNFTYDKVNNVLTVNDKYGTSTLTYDALNRVISEERTDLGQSTYKVSYQYDLNGNRIRLGYPGTKRNVRQTFDRANRLATVVDDNATTTTSDDKTTQYSYDPNSNILTEELPNHVVTTKTYDALNRMTSIVSDEGATSIYDTTYTFDLLGNRTQVHETVDGQLPRTIDYSYDELYRILSESVNGVPTSYTYDRAGNRLSKAIGGVTLNYTYNARNELESIDNGTTYFYDGNGNLSQKISGSPSVTTDYTWDSSNRLIAAFENNVQIFSARYDYRTRRIQTVESGASTNFRYSGGLALQELKGGTVSLELVRGDDLGGGVGSILYNVRYKTVSPAPGVPRPIAIKPVGKPEYVTSNHVGHTVALTDQSGIVSSTELYDAFGRSVSTTGTSQNTRKAYTKERSSALKLDNHGFRYYDPEIGRYISRDPAGYVDGLNVYLHTGNNPVNRFDPDGLFWGFVVDAASVAYDTYQYASGNISGAEYSVSMGINAASLAANSVSFGTAGLGVRAGAMAARAAKAGERIKAGVEIAARAGKRAAHALGEAVDGARAGFKSERGAIGEFARVSAGKGVKDVEKGTAKAAIEGIESRSIRQITESDLAQLPDYALKISETNVIDTGITALGRFDAPPGVTRFKNYIEFAEDKSASYFSFGGKVWDSLSPAQREIANLHFLDVIAAKGDKVILNVPRAMVQSGKSLSREIEYLTKVKGYKWVNSRTLKPRQRL